MLKQADTTYESEWYQDRKKKTEHIFLQSTDYYHPLFVFPHLIRIYYWLDYDFSIDHFFVICALIECLSATMCTHFPLSVYRFFCFLFYFLSTKNTNKRSFSLVTFLFPTSVVLASSHTQNICFVPTVGSVGGML